ncbi:hypothetical protein BOTNAR_0360g00050 [Botryotinia narcissicola]|uniref:Uncharacterized protein n=1 Tax=Botryotinia narcissicola TaxID=278944 RepID=A0A4Z1HR31_9HELO|nr:hypothetical protein BOTNAR_0360g00050 [Botryotinia narcissicola]
MISGDTPLAWDLVFDTVTVTISYPDFFSENFEEKLLDIHFTKVLYRLVFGTLTGVFDPVEQYESWMSRILLREWERSTSKDESSDAWKGISLSTLRGRAALRFEHYDRPIQNDTLRRDHDDQFTGEERNIFATSKSYFGIGACGKNEPGSPSAVQVNGKIAIIPVSEQPLILRLCGSEEDKVVGPSLIPGLEMDESVKVEKKKPMEVTCIL